MKIKTSVYPKKIKTIKRQISKHKNIVMTDHHTTSGNVNSF